ncbi:hypothetical protein FRC17_006922, partial [Serendipita sp. 399]
LKLEGYTSNYIEDLQRLSLLTLKELNLVIVNESRTANAPVSHQVNPLPAWKLPSLVKLSIEVEDLPEFSRWLASVDMPCLQFLSTDIFGGDRNDSFPAGVVYPSLYSLVLVADRAENYFIQALEAAPNVSEVEIRSVSLPLAEDRGSAFLTRLSERTSGILCPRIARMTINGGERGLIGLREKFEPLLRRVIESRTGVLEKFEVEWLDHGGYKRNVVDYTKEL